MAYEFKIPGLPNTSTGMFERVKLAQKYHFTYGKSNDGTTVQEKCARCRAPLGPNPKVIGLDKLDEGYCDPCVADWERFVGERLKNHEPLSRLRAEWRAT